MAEEGKLRVVGEEEPYLLTSCGTGRYEFSIGEGGGYSKLLEKPRLYYTMTAKEFERLANTGVVNLEAELGKINPEMTDRLKGFKVNWEDLSIFLGKCSIDEEDRKKAGGVRARG